MSNQTRYSIDISDIVALRFQCKHCCVTLSLILTAEMRIALHDYPNCKEPWLSAHGSTIEPAVKDLVKNLHAMSSALRIRETAAKDEGVSLTLELTSSLPMPH